MLGKVSRMRMPNKISIREIVVKHLSGQIQVVRISGQRPK